MGKPAAASAGEVAGAVRLVNFFAGQVELLYGQTCLNDPHHIHMSMRQPFGVVAAIIPWNFPTQIVSTLTLTVGSWHADLALTQFCHEMPAACGAGNAIILKVIPNEVAVGMC